MFVILIFFTVFSICVLAWIVTSGRRKKRSWKMAWVAVAALVFTLSAFRVGGSDWDNYEALYSSITSTQSLTEAIRQNPFFEPGYVAWNYAFTRISADRRILVVAESAINAAGILYLLSRVEGGPLLVIWLFPLQFAHILGVRQTMATSLFILCVLCVKRGWRTFLGFAAVLTHLSAVVLLAARYVSDIKLTAKRVITLLVSTGIVFLVFKEMFSGKLANYMENSTNLTGFSSLELFIGKSVTIVLLAGFAFVTRYLTPQTERQPLQIALYLLATIILVFSIIIPPLTRLVTPVELLIAWGVCSSIMHVPRRRDRVVLCLSLVLVASLKMVKIQAQLQDVYQVCFFCVSL